MTTVKAAWPQARPIFGGAALAVATLVNAASLYLGIVFWPLLVLTLTYPWAALLILVVGLRIGRSRLGGIAAFAVGVAAHSAGLVGYLVTMSWANAVSSDGNLPLVFYVAFYGDAALMIAGYGIILGALVRAAILFIPRAA